MIFVRHSPEADKKRGAADAHPGLLIKFLKYLNGIFVGRYNVQDGHARINEGIPFFGQRPSFSALGRAAGDVLQRAAGNTAGCGFVGIEGLAFNDQFVVR